MKARIPSIARLKASLTGRKQDDGEPIDIDKVVRQASTQGARYSRLSGDGILTACKKNGLEKQAQDIFNDACGLKAEGGEGGGDQPDAEAADKGGGESAAEGDADQADEDNGEKTGNAEEQSSAGDPPNPGDEPTQQSAAL